MNLLFEKYELTKLNNKDARIHIKAKWDFDSLADGFIEFDDKDKEKEFYNKVNNGDLIVAFVLVTANCIGVEGKACAGGIVVKDELELEKEVKEHGLVLEAIESLNKQVTSIVKAFA